MSFKEALANFINGYEEPKPTEEPEPVEEEATGTGEEPKTETEETGESEASTEEPEDTGEPESNTGTEDPKSAGTQTDEPGRVDTDSLRIMSEMILASALTPGAAKALTDEKREELLSLPAGDFVKAVNEFNAHHPPVSGRIAKASKPKKQEIEEDWTLALFNS